MKEFISRAKNPLMVAQREKELMEAREDVRLAEEEHHKADIALTNAFKQKQVTLVITLCINSIS